ncbi:MAG TPA: hypothetical protein VJR91_20265, partial [Burkholderia sp.]|nr:hypothetical protein [Burkholderia sp.]
RTCDLDTLVDKALAGAAKGVHAIGPLVAQTDAGKPAGEAECASPGVPIVTPSSNLSTAAPSEAACPSACATNPNGNPS